MDNNGEWDAMTVARYAIVKPAKRFIGGATMKISEAILQLIKLREALGDVQVVYARCASEYVWPVAIIPGVVTQQQEPTMVAVMTERNDALAMTKVRD